MQPKDAPDMQTTDAGREYEKALMSVLSSEKKDFPSYFGGMMVASGNEFIISSPIDDTIRYGIFQEPEEGIMEEAVDASVKTFGEWKRSTVDERVKVFEGVLANYRSRRLFYAASVTVSTGMVREDALSEVDAFISAVESAITEAKSMKGKPTGVWAIVSEHNSPLASPAGAAVACMLGGNCVIMNPTRDAPYPIYQFYEACEKAGLPGGVMNLVVDRKLESTQDLVCDMRLSGVVASGSGKRMDDLMFMMIDDELRFVYDIKGMNPALVYRPADMKATVKDIIESAFAYSGQRLYSCSKVVVLMEDQKRFMDVLTEYMKDVKVDDPVNDTAFAGPLISMDAAKSYRETVERHLEFVVAKGSAVINLPDNYVRPVAVTGIPLEDSLDYEDTGLPILDVKVVDSLESAFEELEDTECGLSAGLFSKDQKVIDRFKKQVDVPLQYINKSSRTLAHGLPAKVSLYTK